MTTSLYFIQLLSICLYFLAPIDWSSVYKSEVLMPVILLILYSAVYGRLTAPTLGEKLEQDDDDDDLTNDYMNTPRLQERFIDSDSECDDNDADENVKKSSIMSKLFGSFTNTKGSRIDRVYNKSRRSIANRVHEQNRQLTQINAYVLHKGKLVKTPITLLDILEIFEKRVNI